MSQKQTKQTKQENNRKKSANQKQSNNKKVETLAKSDAKKPVMNQKKFWKTFALWFGIELLVVLLVGGFFIYQHVMNRNVGGGEEMPETLTPAVVGEPRNVLVLGTDKSGLLSDVIMVFNVDPKQQTLSLLSVPRDTKVKFKNEELPDEVRAKGVRVNEEEPLKINSALQVGGDEFAVKTVKKELGIPIHDYVVVNFNAVETLIDELGGVQFHVPQNMHYEDPEQDLYIHLNKGDQLLNGKKAVEMLRFRNYVMGDLDRNKVQQEFFQAAFAQKFQPQYLLKLPDIYGLINQNMRSNMSLGEIMEYMNMLSDMDHRVVQNFELPVDISDPFVVIKEEEADEILTQYYCKQE